MDIDVPPEGPYPKLDPGILDNLSHRRLPSDIYSLMLKLIKIRKVPGQRYLGWQILQDLGQVRFQEYWSLYEDQFHTIWLQSWKQAPTGDQVVDHDFFTQVYTQINDEAHFLLRGVEYKTSVLARSRRSH